MIRNAVMTNDLCLVLRLLSANEALRKHMWLINTEMTSLVKINCVHKLKPGLIEHYLAR